MNWLESWFAALSSPGLIGDSARVQFLLILIVGLLVAGLVRKVRRDA